ncbi:hypothetical protein ROZALSC1DRAFT_29432, partial [Rozella allomycis CSF55]
MFTGAMFQIRRKKFEIFYYTHHLAIVWSILVFLHGIGCFVRTEERVCKGYFTWKYALAGFILFLIERGLREVRARRLTYISKIIEHPSKVIELQFQKPSFSYKPGQYVFICIPEISKYQWHPFTLSSCPEDDHHSVHIRVCGDWTSALANRLGCFKKKDQVKTYNGWYLPKIYVDGPYGTPTEDVFQYDSALIVGAGIGVTPFASVLKHIWYRKTRNIKENTKLQTLHFVWICRDKNAFEWFHSLLEAMEKDCPSEFLHFH